MSYEKNCTVYSVGDKFDRKMDKEGAIFEVEDNLCQCIISLSDISKQEKEAIEKGDITVTLGYIDGIIYINLIANNTLLFNMPFNMGRYDTFRLKEPQKDSGYTMLIFIVDHDTNIIKAMRAVGFYENFSRRLYDFSKKQWENRIEDYEERCTAIEQKYSPIELAAKYCECNVFEAD